MLSDDQLRRYLADRHAFRREQVILPSGRRFGEVEEEWQTEHVFAPLDARDGDDWRYRLLYFELHRGAAKTFALAMEALAVGILDQDVRAYFVAADSDQARIAKDMLTGMILRNPALQPAFRILKDEITVPSTGTVIKVMSSDAPTAYGLGALGRGFLVLADELWAWKGRELWDAMFSAGPKSEDWRIIVGSNAGHDQESIAWGTREMCRTQIDPRYYFYGPEGVVAGWIKPEEVEAQRRSLPDPVFARLWENRWVAAEGSFVDVDAWDACHDPTLPPLRAPVHIQVRTRVRNQLVLGVDAGVKHDHFGVVAVSRHPDPERHDTDVAIRWAKVWAPPRGGAISFYGPDSPDDAIRKFCAEHDVVTLVADPYQLVGLMQEWERDAVVWVQEFTQGTPRLAADSLLLSLIYEQRLVYGDDVPEELRKHVLGAAFKIDVLQDSKLRIVKSHPSRKIDLTVALSMASHESLRLLLD